MTSLEKASFNQREETEQSKPITIIFDFGQRSHNYGSDKPLRQALANHPNTTVIEADQRHKPNLENLDPKSTLVIACTSTIDFDFYRNAGLTVYPNPESLTHVSDKFTLYETCRKYNIPTVLTFRLPGQSLDDNQITGKLTRLEEAINTGIVKPKNTFGSGRDVLKQIYLGVRKTFGDYKADRDKLSSTQPNEEKADFVLQKELPGLAMKVFGAWPDHFFYLDEDNLVKECAPNIKRTCKLLFELYNIRFGGLDFMVNDDGVWLMIDVNPPSGGREIPEPEQLKLIPTMREHAQALLNNVPLILPEQNVVIQVAAAGKGSRLAELTGGTLPKSLLPVTSEKTVLDYSLLLAQSLANQDGFDPQVRLMVLDKERIAFSEWLDKRELEEKIDLVVPDQNQISRDTSFNHLIASLPETSDLVLTIAADRINTLSPEQIAKITKEVHHALVIEQQPYVVVGIEDSSSKHRYQLDPNGRILKYMRGGTEGIGIKGEGIARIFAV